MMPRYGMNLIMSRWQFSILACLGLSVLAGSVRAQSIAPAIDGTGTRITQTGNTFVIDGGTRAGANLFQSFQRFGLNAVEIADFTSNPSIQNILGRVTGGDVSLINGLIRVTGGNSNLYLINPAGMIFGQNARLDVPGSFIATTATAIGLGDRWFNAIGSNDYAALTGTPTRLAFMTPQPGAIVNAGDLAVGQGQSLLLVGGTVVNTGRLSAPGGNITIAAVPGETLVRLTPENSLLSLEVFPIAASPSPLQPLPFTPATLPQLLTGGNAVHATGITVENGIVRLTGSGVTIPDTPGVAVASGQLSVASTQSPTASSQITVLGRTVGLIGATLDASGVNGGTVRIGGDFQGGRGDGETGAVGFPAPSTLPPRLSSSLNASQTVIDPTSTIRTDGLNRGNGGRVIAWADQVMGFYGNISARGGNEAGTGGLVEVSGKQQLIFRGSVDTNAPGGNAGTLLLDPVNITIADGTFDSAADGATTFAGNVSGVVGSLLSNPPSAVNDIAPTTIFKSELEGLAGSTNIVLQATNDITIAPGTFLSLASGSGSIIFQADADSNGVGNFSMDTAQYINTGGRPISITAANITVGDIVGTDDPGLSTRGQTGGAGNVSLTATNGNIITGSIFANSGTDADPNAPNSITLNAPNGAIVLSGIIQAGYINTTGDNTITITARSFRATNPINVSPSDGFDPATGPAVNLYAFPANQDGSTPFRQGAFQVQFQDQTPVVTGSGNTLITLRLLEDTTFTVGRPLNPTGSGTTGTVSLGVGSVPNALVLIQDNQFSALLNTDTVTDAARSTATVLEQQQFGTPDDPQNCDPSPTQEQILQVSMATPESVEQPRSDDRPTSGLPPCDNPQQQR
jgi:filamentous hemagglutinin family protein